MTAAVKPSKLGLFEFNPRGNLWYNDESTFGHKLLAKMGWSKGKGLGKNENGIKENVKVGKKDDLTGIGYKHDFNITVGCAEYEDILSKLQKKFNNKGTKVKDTNESEELESLEKRSQTSRSRLHYQKFVRVKDIHSRSEKDMKCIFLDNSKAVAEDISEKEEEAVPTVKSALSVNDYFAMKMKQKFGSNAGDKNQNKNIEENGSNNMKKKRKSPFENDMESKQIEIKSEESCDGTEQIRKSESTDIMCYPNKKIKLEIEEPSNSSSNESIKVKKKHKHTLKSKHLHGDNSLQDLEYTNHLCTTTDTNSEITKPFNSEKDNLKRHKKKSKQKHKLVLNGVRLNTIETAEKCNSNKTKSPSDPEDSSRLDGEEVLNHSSPSTNSIKRKKKKSKKRRFINVADLKSCIKNSGSYDLNKGRKVTFSERVFYKLMDTSFESIDPINDSAVAEEQSLFRESVEPEKELEEGECLSEEEDGHTDESKIVDGFEHGVNENDTNVKLNEDTNTELNENAITNKDPNIILNEGNLLNPEEGEKLPACFDLPKNQSSNFNLWLESQRAALKMDLYKSMIDKMKTHKVLRTTNLLDIKGYGNWGK